MASVFQEQVPAFAHLFKHRICLDGSSGTFYRLFSSGQDKNRPVITFPDPSGNDSRQTFMTIRKVNYQHPVISQRTVFNLPNPCFYPLLCHRLPFVIQIF